MAGVVALSGRMGTSVKPAIAAGGGSYTDSQVQQDGARVSYVVFHAVDRDGFCDAAAFGAVSLHPVLTDAPNDTMVNGATGLPNPRATLDVFVDSGDGVIVETNMGPAGGVRTLTGLKTFSTYDNVQLGSPVKAFAPLQKDIPDECQAWVKIVSSLGQPANVLMIFHDDEGDLGFDNVVNAPRTASVLLNPRWNLVSWQGPDAAPVADALSGTGSAGGGSDITASVSAVYGWDNATGTWLAYFPGAGGVPGASTLTSLKAGQPYWFAVSGSSPMQWTVRTP
jgi:hypothetical protein